MNFFKKIHELLRQKEQIVKKPQKHDANLQKNSTLYFQVGLILCLLFTNALFEMYFETKAPTTFVYEYDLEDVTYIPTPVVKEKPIAMLEPEPIPRRVTTIHNPIIKDNDDIIKPVMPVITLPDLPDVNPPAPTPVTPPKIYSTINVEQVPIFPGCEEFTENSDRVKCMSDKLSRIIQRKFDGDVAVEQGLEGVQRIFVQFTIDKTGNITEIKARTPHASLEQEAKRVMTKVPKMQPGMQQNTPVDVVYSLPIIFKVQN